MKMEIWSGKSSDGFWRISIKDCDANKQFVEVKITPHDFACMLATMPVQCEGEVMNLDRVGKKRVWEQRQVVYDGQDRDKEVIRAWLREKHKDDGWEMNDRLNSQSSIGYNHKTSQYFVNYIVEKWT